MRFCLKWEGSKTRVGAVDWVIFAVFSTFAAFFACPFANAWPAPAPALTDSKTNLPTPPALAAKSYLLIDVTANQILAAQDVDLPVEPASLTKLMTAYLVFDALKSKKIDLHDLVAISQQAVHTPGARLFLDPKARVPVEDLLKAVAVLSANEASLALAEAVGGNAAHFVEMMNQQAQVLGMKNTHFKNPEGASEPGQVTTARDLGFLATRLMADFPSSLAYFSQKQHQQYPYRISNAPANNNGNSNNNTNTLLLRDPTVDGLKTGHSDTGGYSLIATAKRAAPGVGPRRLLSVVIGAASDNARTTESQKLLNWGYTAFEAVKLFEAGVAVTAPDVWKGNAKSLPLGQPNALVVDVPTGRASQLRATLSRPDPLVAPYFRGQPVGQLKVTLADQPYLELPLVALASVDQAGLLGRAWDALRLWIR
jgi:D-alanyl-D-alanine carboxypeptidase (penicillin-binding protein 5/6)